MLAVSVEQRLGECRVAAREAEAHQRRERRRRVLEAFEQPLGLLVTALSQPQVGEHGERQRATAAVAVGHLGG